MVVWLVTRRVLHTIIGGFLSRRLSGQGQWKWSTSSAEGRGLSSKNSLSAKLPVDTKTGWDIPSQTNQRSPLSRNLPYENVLRVGVNGKLLFGGYTFQLRWWASSGNGQQRWLCNTDCIWPYVTPPTTHLKMVATANLMHAYFTTIKQRTGKKKQRMVLIF